MFFSKDDPGTHTYQAVSDNDGKDQLPEPGCPDAAYEATVQERPQILRRLIKKSIFFSLAILGGFAAGALATRHTLCPAVSSGTAPRIPIPTIQGEFVYSSPFSEEPPQGPGTGNVSEPIWDALVPRGLGYFKDGKLAEQISIPTAMHQLHCLYVVRRAYYSQSQQLQEFDFGKNRTAHAAHCFDYLAQSITCAVDSTIEPAIDDPNVFLGSGFPRQCRDFGALKQFLDENRVFDATGFLAHGLDHGHVHIEST